MKLDSLSCESVFACNCRVIDEFLQAELLIINEIELEGKEVMLYTHDLSKSVTISLPSSSGLHTEVEIEITRSSGFPAEP